MTKHAARISEKKAIEIATTAVIDKAEILPSSTIQVESSHGKITVTFVRSNPPGTLAPDYDAQVTIDAATGAVLQILGAP